MSFYFVLFIHSLIRSFIYLFTYQYINSFITDRMLAVVSVVNYLRHKSLLTNDSNVPHDITCATDSITK
jgi:hypothetical protein